MRKLSLAWLCEYYSLHLSSVFNLLQYSRFLPSQAIFNEPRRCYSWTCTTGGDLQMKILCSSLWSSSLLQRNFLQIFGQESSLIQKTAISPNQNKISGSIDLSLFFNDRTVMIAVSVSQKGDFILLIISQSLCSLNMIMS